MKNIMAVTGEDIRYGDHPQARTVNDLDLMDLLTVIRGMENGKDMAGVELKGTPRFCIGSAVDTAATGGLLEIEVENVRKMAELGVNYVITNPIFDLRRFQQFLKRMDTDRPGVIAKVLVLKSAGMARYIDRNVKGVHVPSEMIRRIQKAAEKREECIRIAGELVSRIKKMGMAGVLISTMGWEDRLPLILDQAKT